MGKFIYCHRICYNCSNVFWVDTLDAKVQCENCGYEERITHHESI